MASAKESVEENNLSPIIAVIPINVDNSASLSLINRIIPAAGPPQKKGCIPIAANLDFATFHYPIETKYYSAAARICHVTEKNLGPRSFAESIEGLIAHVDPQQDPKSSLNQWKSFINQWDPSLKLLVCEKFHGEEQKYPMLDWCIENEFELIELDPDEEAKAEFAEFNEKFGVDRIAQALRSHEWSSAELKDDEPHEEHLRRLKEMLFEEEDLKMQKRFEEQSSSSAENSASTFEAKLELSKPKKSKEEAKAESAAKIDSLFADSDMEFFNAVAGGEDGSESFEALFEKFAELKQKAADLPPDERKNYAEKVTMAFWRAIGGDEEEIAGVGENSSGDEN